MNQPKILVIEDDREIREMVTAILENQDYCVVQAADGRAGLAALTPDVKALVLDVEMPVLGGLEVLREIRKTNSIPILILSSRSDGKDRVEGLNLGADDYLGKPFLPEELLARVAALLRRAWGDNISKSEPGGLRIDTDGRRVYLDENLVELTPREFNLVKTLVSAPGRAFSRDELIERAWGHDADVSNRQVDLAVSKIRKKFKILGKAELISSVWGVGYRFDV